MEDVSPGIEAAARALCAADVTRVTEPARSQYIEEQWPTYVSRAQDAIGAYAFSQLTRQKEKS